MADRVTRLDTILTGDSSSYVAAAKAKTDADNAMAASGAKVDASIEQTQRKLEPTSGAFNRLAKSLDPLAYKLTPDLAKNTGILAAALEKGSISADEHQRLTGLLTNRYAGLAAQLLASNSNVKESAIGMGSLVRESRALFDELSSGRSRQAIGSFTLLLTRGLGVGLGTLGGIAAALAIPVGVIASIATAQTEYDQLAAAIRRSGGAAGESQGEIEASIRKLTSAAGGTRGELVGVATELLNTGRIGGQTFQNLLGLTRQYADATGQSFEKAGTELAKAFADPTKGAKLLDDQLNFLSDSELQQIRAMQQSGNLIGAQNALFQDLAPKVKSASDQVDIFTRAWRATKAAFSETVAAVGSIGVPELPEQMVERLKREAANAQRAAAPQAQFAPGVQFAPVVADQRRADQALSYATSDLLQTRPTTVYGAQDAADRLLGKNAGDVARQVDELGTRLEELKQKRDLLTKAIDAGQGPLDQERAALARVNVEISAAENPFQRDIRNLQQQVQESQLSGRAAAELAAEIQLKNTAEQLGIPVSQQAIATARQLAGAEYDLKLTKDAQKESIEAATRAAVDEEKARSAAFKRSDDLLQDRDKLASSIDREIASQKALAEAAKQGKEALAEEQEYQQLAQRYGAIGMGPASPEEEAALRNKAKELAQYRKEVSDAGTETKNLNQFGVDLGHTLASSFGRAIEGGSKFRDIVKGLEADLEKLLEKWLIEKPLDDLFSSLFGGGGGGGSGGSGGGAGFGAGGGVLNGFANSIFRGAGGQLESGFGSLFQDLYTDLFGTAGVDIGGVEPLTGFLAGGEASTALGLGVDAAADIGADAAVDIGADSASLLDFLPLLFGKGGVISRGRVVKRFADGGVVTDPTYFALQDGGSGGIGLMGEAGDEGILPLAQVGGKLGVHAGGLGRGGDYYHIDARGSTNPEETKRQVAAALAAARPGIIRDATGAAVTATFGQIRKGGTAAQISGRRR